MWKVISKRHKSSHVDGVVILSEKLVLNYPIRQDDYVNGGKASSEIKRILTEFGLNQNLIRKIAISTYEAEMNLVIHSYGGELICEIDDQKICIISMDQGPGIANIEQAMQPGFSTANEKAREMGFGAGMGLPNMKKNSDQFTIESSESGTRIDMCYFL